MPGAHACQGSFPVQRQAASAREGSAAFRRVGGVAAPQAVVVQSKRRGLGREPGPLSERRTRENAGLCQPGTATGSPVARAGCAAGPLTRRPSAPLTVSLSPRVQALPGVFKACLLKASGAARLSVAAGSPWGFAHRHAVLCSWCLRFSFVPCWGWTGREARAGVSGLGGQARGA